MNFKNKKLLIVEDDPIIYEDLADFFTGKGLLVLQENEDEPVDCYNSAIKLADFHDPDIAIVDITLIGDETGLDVCRYLRRKHNTFIVILSSNTVDLRMDRDLVDGYVLKLGKALDNQQLWTQLLFHYPFPDNVTDKNSGYSFTVRNGFGPKFNFYNLFIQWKELVCIEAFNASRGKGNNNVQLILKGTDKELFCRTTLAKVEVLESLPDYFVKINRSQIINRNFIVRTSKRREFFIDQILYRIGKDYDPDLIYIPD